MRNLIRFIFLNHFLLLFILFEIASFMLVFQKNSYQGGVAFNISRTISGKINSRIFNYRQYFDLLHINNELMEENQRLRNSLISSHKQAVPVIEGIEFDSAWVKHYNFVPARIISNSVNKQKNFITIDKGSIHEIEPDMPIISPNGIVGIVTGVSNHFATVISVLNIDLSISAKIKSSGYFGSLTWDGKDPGYVTLNDIPHHVQLMRGDTIVTSGLSAIFPEGIEIGIIDDFEIKGANFFNINVKLLNDFRKLSSVTVIQNLFIDELTELENTTRYD